jgi:hypothetical protein
VNETEMARSVKFAVPGKFRAMKRIGVVGKQRPLNAELFRLAQPLEK